MKRITLLFFALVMAVSVYGQEPEVKQLPEWDYSAENTPEEVIESQQYTQPMRYVALGMSSAPKRKTPFRLAVDVAWAHRLGEAVEGVEDIIDEMRNGITYGVDVHWFPWTFIGIGAKVGMTHYWNEYREINDKINLFHIAPSVAFQTFNRRGNRWIITASLGYVNFNETVNTPYSKVKSSNGGVMFHVDYGYDIRLGGNTFLGFKLGLHGGAAKTDYSSDWENVSSIQLGGGLRF